MIADPVLVATQAGLGTPENAPDADLDHDGGSLLAATYTYAITATDGLGGETPLGPPVSVTIPPGFPASEITVSAMDEAVTAVGGTGYRLWRRVNGGTWGLVSDGATSEIVDDGTLCVDCTVSPPASATGHTNATNTLSVRVPVSAASGAAYATAAQFSIYASPDGTFGNPSLLGTYPIGDLGSVKTYTELALADGAPPENSLALPGASKLDALTDLLNLPFGAPVTNPGDLPTGVMEGEARVVTSVPAIYLYTSGAWHALATGGGGGGGGGGGAALPNRVYATIYANGLAANGSIQQTWPLGYGYRLYNLFSYQTTVRVRLYTRPDMRAADVARATGVAPPANAGVILDITLPSGEVQTLTPAVYGFNDDDTPTGNVYAQIDSVGGSSGDVEFSVTYAVTESEPAFGSPAQTIGVPPQVVDS